jgi:hypothetical protein
MTGQNIAIAIIVLIVFLLPVVISQRMQAKANRESIETPPGPRERFCVSRFVFAAVLFGNAVGALFVLILVLIPNKDPGSILFFGGLAFIGFVGTWITTIRLRSTFVVIDATTMDYSSGKKRVVIERNSIKSVYTQSGMIGVDTGTVPRHVIPMIFAGSHQLIARLSRRS